MNTDYTDEADDRSGHSSRSLLLRTSNFLVNSNGNCNSKSKSNGNSDDPEESQRHSSVQLLLSTPAELRVGRDVEVPSERAVTESRPA